MVYCSRAFDLDFPNNDTVYWMVEWLLGSGPLRMWMVLAVVAVLDTIVQPMQSFVLVLHMDTNELIQLPVDLLMMIMKLIMATYFMFFFAKFAKNKLHEYNNVKK